MFQTVAENLVPMALLMLAGVVARKLGVLTDEASSVITKILINIALPAAIITGMQREFTPELLASGLMVLGVSALCQLVFMGLGAVLCKLLKIPKGRRAVFILVLAFGNVAFMGIPVITAILGPEVLYYVTMANIAFNLVVFTLGVHLIRADGDGAQKVPFVKGIITNVPLLSSILGVALFAAQLELPGPLALTLDHAGAMMTPLSMIIMGGLLAKNRLADLFTDRSVLLLSVIRMVVLPVAAVFALGALIPDGQALDVLIKIIAMPAAVLIAILAQSHNADAAYAGRAVFVSTTMSLFTLPLIALI